MTYAVISCAVGDAQAPRGLHQNALRSIFRHFGVTTIVVSPPPLSVAKMDKRRRL
jgi:hypothetical protein